MLVPLLIEARNQGWESLFVEELLKSLGLSQIAAHPGYQLRVHTLGTFQVWLGEAELAVRAWRREKSRQMFQLMLTYHDAPLDREQIYEYLWPDASLEAAHRNFKVALNTLFQVLEPYRKSGQESAYILREGRVYGLRPHADIWVDAFAFKDAVGQAEACLPVQTEAALAHFERAYHLYRGEYLPDTRYEAWAVTEREHLKRLFLRVADFLCETYLARGQPQDALQVGQQMLSCDNCWERAYRFMMSAYYAMGDQGQVARTYQRCVHILRDELDVQPAQETAALYQKLTGQRAPGL